MQLIRNPEIKKMIAFCMAFIVLVSIGAYICFDVFVMLYLLSVCVCLMMIFLWMTKQRYEDISILSHEIDKILHTTERNFTLPDKEGELAILTHQISKMTIRLREQSEQLRDEKENLRSAIADISHQIRTPLTTVRMIIHRLMSAELTGEQRNENISEINSMLSRVESLVTALLKIARLESGLVEFEQVPVNIKQLLLSALEPLEIIAEIKEIHIDMDISTDIIFSGDMLWTMEAVCNILKNCIEHTPAGGTLTIRAVENSLYTQIKIADDGVGISEEDLPHLFERFYKGKQSNSQNVGIGLALSRMIIHRQNGTIKIKRVSPHGTEFVITFYKGAI